MIDIQYLNIKFKEQDLNPDVVCGKGTKKLYIPN